MMREPDESVWGKSRGLERPYPLVRHLLDSAAMAGYLWDAYLSESQRAHIAAGLGAADDPTRARLLVALCAGLHDVGKVSGFQFCDARGRGQLSEVLVADAGQAEVQRVGHALAGMQVAPVLLTALGFKEDGTGGVSALERVAEVIGGHHGVFGAFEREVTDTAAYQALFGGSRWADERVAHGASVFGLLGGPRGPEVFEASAAVLVTGVVVLADWLVSQEYYLLRRQRGRRMRLREHFAESVRLAPGLARQAGLAPVELARKEFGQAYGIEGGPNALQSSVVAGLERVLAAPGAGRAGILVVTAAPGDGKSETALEAERVFARVCGTRGFAFLLPTMATSDQMHGRVAGSLVRQGGGGGGLTLSHSMAWLSAAYSDQGASGDGGVLVGAEEHVPGVGPVQWLRGSKRALLAQWSVGTIDQALMSVLPVRHNALRLLALSGKTVIVDEAHAYDPYMQVLLGRLLNWLGALGVPVVLLSATLPVSISDRLVREYLQGAGHSSRALKRCSFRVPYPGWLYVDAVSGEQASIGEEDLALQVGERATDLAVTVEPVNHLEPAQGGARARLAVIERLVDPLVTGADGGCALVVCNTVDEAQDTFVWLRDRLRSRGLEGGGIELLHARLPADVREARTIAITGGLGRDGGRPAGGGPVRRIVVGTQVVEQSLDLDADVVISDLAPLALLLQRAGRCWRHETWWCVKGRPRGPRPLWAAGKGGPHLIVLDPLAGGGAVPVRWGTVYPEYLLLETSRVLADRDGGRIAIPGEVQQLVEQVHGDRADRFDWESPRWEAAWTAQQGDEFAQRSVGENIAIPRKRSVRRLYQLHERGVADEGQAATRLGADSVRLLCVFEQESGGVTLDLVGDVPLPGPGGDGRMSIEAVRAVMKRTVPVRADWFSPSAVEFAVPEVWAGHPFLGELVVLRQAVVGGEVRPAVVLGKAISLDAELGIVRR
ncbi:CRISPR-associated helicase Cas3' (plasmid) [Streptomyces sp. NBC_00464]|uniref:CRISPR-associated helicase Cas3' n=1 Tax=Streptomyces sp. NBC_00464 TaxID=2975751 RepID=UPI002E176F42